MADYVPVFDPGTVLTLTASAPITGGQLLRISGNNTVAPTSGPSADWLGVAANDAIVGDDVTIYRMGIQRLTVSSAGTITAGQNVDGTANGQVAAHTNGTNDYTAVGIALTTGAPGSLIEISMRR